MASYQIPGPSCRVGLPLSMDEGTLALCLTPAPGTVCSNSWLYPTRALFCSLQPPNKNIDLSFLFMQCLNPSKGLTEQDYKTAAAKIDVEVATIKAVAEVESSGSAFDDDGRPKILFERHYFHRLTGGKYDGKHADISNKKSGGYGKFSAQYGKLERAYHLNADAALRSASWGKFQIMGDNYKAAGFSTVQAFVMALTKAESEHLHAFTSFVGHNKSMLKALKNKDWAEFAAKYNGPKYKQNKYDSKLKDAYERHKPKPVQP